MSNTPIMDDRKIDTDAMIDAIDRAAEQDRTHTGTPSCEVSSPSEASEASKINGDDMNLGNEIFDKLRTYIGASTDDLIVLTLWILHTHVYTTLYTTPRLLITSIMPGCGKSLVMDWLARLCCMATPMSAVSSASMLANLANQQHTLLVDEADRALRKDNPLTADFIAIINSGYKHGGGRPVQQQDKSGVWQVVEMKTFAPVAFAGNDPDLPEDTEQRCIRIFLYPDDSITETDFEQLDRDKYFTGIQQRLAEWSAAAVKSGILDNRPALGDAVKGRAREIWSPLSRVAQACNEHTANSITFNWLDETKRMAGEFVEQAQIDRDEGLRKTTPHLALLKDVAELWSMKWKDKQFVGSNDLCNALAAKEPTSWGAQCEYGSRITTRRLASMLKKTGVTTARNKDNTQRGYYCTGFASAWDSLHVWKMLGIKPESLPDALDGSDGLDTSVEGMCPQASKASASAQIGNNGNTGNNPDADTANVTDVTEVTDSHGVKEPSDDDQLAAF